MGKSNLKVRSSPVKTKRQEIENRVNHLFFNLLTVSVFSTNRAILSHGGLKPKFIYNEEGIFKEPPFHKGL